MKLFSTAILVFLSACVLCSGVENQPLKIDVVGISFEQQYDSLRPKADSALAVRFELEKGWHFYASKDSAPGGQNLKIKINSDSNIKFGEPVFPVSQRYLDKNIGQELDVFSDKFTVFVPFAAGDIDLSGGDKMIEIKIIIQGAVCSDLQCRMINSGEISEKIIVSDNASMAAKKFEVVRPAIVKIVEKNAKSTGLSYSLYTAIGLALLAGLILNIMPCVWPVLPIIVLRIVGQAKKSQSASFLMGLAFCFGIILFFAVLAIANIILQQFYGTVLQWGDQFRNPSFVITMAGLLVVLALFMFDVFAFTLPSSVGSQTDRSGYLGSIATGFFAAVLSTPCSFGILAAAFAWAQAQPLLPATIVILCIGIGMALPYAVLTSIPSLVNKLPRPGRWMDLFKQAVGFILLGIAAWMITVVPESIRSGVLYFTVVLGFCCWMWGKFVDYNDSTLKRWSIRLLAVVIIVLSGLWLLKTPEKIIDWQGYDTAVIEQAKSEGRPILIKFTADWCLSCKAVEKIVYSRSDIAQLIKTKKVLAVKADTTAADYPATIALKQIYQEPGVPVSILMVPGKNFEKRWHDKSFGNELRDILKGLP
jgi:thiol:disulfide interchange protein